MESTQLPPPPQTLPTRRGKTELAPTRHGNGEHADRDIRPGDSQPPAQQDHAHGNGHGDPHEDWGEIRRPRSFGMIVLAVAVALVLVALFLTGLIPRVRSDKELNADADAVANGPVLVNVAKPTVANKVVDLTVPGTLRPWQEVSVYARTSGYLRKWYADISNQVKPGQLLAEIDSPTVDADLKVAEASLGQTRANLAKAQSDADLQKTTLQRYKDLIATQSVTQQQLDQQQSTFDVALANVKTLEATVASAEANVKKLTDMQAFEKVTAPFAGVITSRPYDTGALILADPTATDIRPLYKIAENDVLRAFVNVPQSNALRIQKGMDTRVTSRQVPNHPFVGKVMGTTNYLDPEARSLLTEIKIPNADGALLPGMYVEVTFSLARSEPPLLIPSPALINSSAGTQVAVVRDDRIHFQKVVLGQDFGNTIEVTSGLNPDDQIVSNPGERIVDGVSAKIANPDKPETVPLPPKEKVAEAGK